MPGSTFGTLFKITTWGESHGPALGAVVDGCPAGLALSADDIKPFTDRRKPGCGAYATKRAEGDEVKLLSGVFEGKTTGSPISLIIENKDSRSSDYEEVKNIYRNGHADYGYDMKYGFRDYRGGGRASGRETAARVAAGAVAVKALNALGIHFLTYVKKIGAVDIADFTFDADYINKNELYIPSAEAFKEASQYLDKVMANGDSAGAVVECRITGVKPGIGSPVFDKLDACLASALFSIGAVKAVEIGAGVSVSAMTALTCNDVFCLQNGQITKKTNNSGGITGGITDGGDIILRLHFKPTPTISHMQDMVDKQRGNVTACVKGRHDPIIAPRACVVAETMAAAVIFDQILVGLPSKMETLTKLYNGD